MSGYSDFSKSNNAVEAESAGRFPASVLAKKLKVQTTAIREVLSPSEYHHTSGWYNSIDYYDGELLLAVAAGNITDLGANDVTIASEQLATLRAWKKPSVTKITYHACTVHWLEWSGSRKHPKGTEHKCDDATIVDKGGSFLTITLPDGTTFRKKRDANGFSAKMRTGILL